MDFPKKKQNKKTFQFQFLQFVNTDNCQVNVRVKVEQTDDDREEGREGELKQKLQLLKKDTF